MQLKLEEANRESNIWRLEAEQSRLKMDIGELEIKIQEVVATSKRQIIAELLDVEQRLGETEITLRSAQRIRIVRLQQAGFAARGEIAREIKVTRGEADKASVMAGDDATPLEPGDVVEVRRLLPSGAAGPDALGANGELKGPSDVASSR